MTTQATTPVKKSRLKRWLKWSAIGGVLFIIFTFVSVEVTSTSKFCNSCHIMEPYYTN